MVLLFVNLDQQIVKNDQTQTSGKQLKVAYDFKADIRLIYYIALIMQLASDRRLPEAETNSYWCDFFFLEDW